MTVLTENSGLFDPDVFPINVATVVAMCLANFALSSSVIEIAAIHKKTFIVQKNKYWGKLLNLLQLSK